MQEVQSSTEIQVNTEIQVATEVEKKKLTVCGVEFAYLYFLAIPVTHIAWLAELAIKLISKGYAEFHAIPFIGVYGLVIFAFQIVLGNPNALAVAGKPIFKKKTKHTKLKSNLLCLAIICIAVFLGELIVGNGADLLFGVQLWDYSDVPLHITNYAGLFPTLGFGIGAFLIFKLYHPVLNFVRTHLKYRTVMIWNCTLGAIIFLDMMIMIFEMIFFHEVNYRMQISI